MSDMSGRELIGDEAIEKFANWILRQYGIPEDELRGVSISIDVYFEEEEKK